MIEPNTCLILDTMSNTDELCKNKDLKWIFFNGRCTHLTFIWTIQQYKSMSNTLIANTDYIFIGQQDGIADLYCIYEKFRGMFPHFDAFHQAYKHYTKDYGYLVIDNISRSDKLEDRVFWYSSTKKENI